MDKQTNIQTRKDQLRRRRRYLRCLRRRRDFLEQREKDLGGRLSREELDRMRQESAALTWVVAFAADQLDDDSAALEAETNGGRP